MFALRTAASRFAPSTLTRARAMGTAATPHGKSAKDIWLGDKATYPIMVIITGACCLGIVWGSKTLLTNKDVRVNKDTRKEILRRE